MKIEKVAAYVRVSTQEQKLHGLSLDAQKMKLDEYAQKNHMRIVEWYVDEGVSGRKLIRNRPELQRMIRDAEAGHFDRIIFIKLDRFFRSVAEYHECMKRISPVTWSTTEEEYDLTTANGRMLVNMKLTIAEMEADQTGERIKIVNEYKVQTGQPLCGDQCMPFGFTVSTDQTGRKKVVHDPDEAEILKEIIDYFVTHQNRRKTLLYLNAKYHVGMSYNTLTILFKNTMLYGAYRDNPTYCEPYITRAEYDRLQDIMERNGKKNTAKNREYIFGGLLICPVCGRRLAGGISAGKNTKKYYKKYRCGNWRTSGGCSFNKALSEMTLEKKMLANIEKYLENAKLNIISVSDDEAPAPAEPFDVDEINAEIDRLNYSWQTGKIRNVEKYEEQYAVLLQRLDEAESVQRESIKKDYSHVESVLSAGWRDLYNQLDDTHKKAFWRSFIRSIEINWTTENKEITRVNFF
jgi:DNA invertase Pin-like site-specific DNA recombinase